MVGEGDDIAAATLAENEIGAGDDARGAIAIEQQRGDEILCRRARERGVEGQDEHRVGARRGEQLLPLVERREAEGRDVGLERSEEHTSELQSLMRISYAVFCLKKKKIQQKR